MVKRELLTHRLFPSHLSSLVLSFLVSRIASLAALDLYKLLFNGMWERGTREDVKGKEQRLRESPFLGVGGTTSWTCVSSQTSLTNTFLHFSHSHLKWRRNGDAFWRNDYIARPGHRIVQECTWSWMREETEREKTLILFPFLFLFIPFWTYKIPFDLIPFQSSYGSFFSFRSVSLPFFFFYSSSLQRSWRTKKEKKWLHHRNDEHPQIDLGMEKVTLLTLPYFPSSSCRNRNQGRNREWSEWGDDDEEEEEGKRRRLKE